jgi:hypothetical protein
VKQFVHKPLIEEATDYLATADNKDISIGFIFDLIDKRFQATVIEFDAVPEGTGMDLLLKTYVFIRIAARRPPFSNGGGFAELRGVLKLWLKRDYG